VRVQESLSIRVAGANVAVPVTIRRRLLWQTRRITDRAQRGRHSGHVIADGLQPLQYRLPLLPIQLPEKRPQSLDEWILQQRFPV